MRRETQNGRNPKFEVQGSKFKKPRTSNFESRTLMSHIYFLSFVYPPCR